LEHLAELTAHNFNNMARNITLILGSGLGIDLGPNFNLTANSSVVTPSTATKTELLAGKIVSVDDVATTVTITSIGTCTNAISQTIVCTPSTTTTTTTPAPTSVTLTYSVQDNPMNSAEWIGTCTLSSDLTVNVDVDIAFDENYLGTLTSKSVTVTIVAGQTVAEGTTTRDNPDSNAVNVTINNVSPNPAGGITINYT